MRRIAAIVLPQLACEIVRQRPSFSRTPSEPSAEPGNTPVSARPVASRGPLAVILDPGNGTEPVLETAVLDVVSDEARRLGVRPGQKVAEAAALAANLSVHRVTYNEIDAALGRVAEVALSFAPTAAVRLKEGDAAVQRTPWGEAPFDTVWLDVTGSAHLAGGEDALLDEIAERVAALGHRARLAIANGPRIAQALARWAPSLQGTPGARASGRHPIAAPGEGARAMAALPVQSLPVDPNIASWLVRLGLITVGDLARMPRAEAQSRLGARASEVLDLLSGRDDLPLVPYAPPRVIVEEASFEEGVQSAPELLFVLRGMCSRAAARLSARGEACTRLEVTMQLDRSIAALRHAERYAELEDEDEDESSENEEEDIAVVGFHVDLPAPLSEGGDLLRALRPKLERTELIAPAKSVQLAVVQIVPARGVQVDLAGRGRAVDPDRLPALLAELSAEIGPERVGLLAIADAHRPEARSRLQPIATGVSNGRGTVRRGGQGQLSFPGAWSAQPRPEPGMDPVRLLPTPIPLGRIRNGAVVAVDQQLFAVEGMRLLMRLDKVEWWTRSPASRDYVRAWLSSGDGKARVERMRDLEGGAHPASKPPAGACGEALLYVDRKTREVFLQGWIE